MEKQTLSTAYGRMATTKHGIIERFRDFNQEHGITYGFQKANDPKISAVIVYAQSNFTREYTEIERSYRVTNQDGKAFFNGMTGNSIYGECLDGSEDGVRLDAYDWEIEKCYFE